MAKKEVQNETKFNEIRKKFLKENEKRIKNIIIKPIAADNELKKYGQSIDFDVDEANKLYKELLDRKKNFFHMTTKTATKYANGINSGISIPRLSPASSNGELYSFPLYIGQNRKSGLDADSAMGIINRAWSNQSESGKTSIILNKMSDSTLRSITVGIDYWTSGLNEFKFKVQSSDKLGEAHSFYCRLNSMNVLHYGLAKGRLDDGTSLEVTLLVENVAGYYFSLDVPSFLSENGHFYLIGEVEANKTVHEAEGFYSMEIVDFKIDSLNYVAYNQGASITGIQRLL